MLTTLSLTLILAAIASAQKSIKPLFPPRSIKPFHSGGGAGGPDHFIDGGIYGGGIVPGRVSFGGLGDLGGSGGILGGHDTGIGDTAGPAGDVFPIKDHYARG